MGLDQVLQKLAERAAALNAASDEMNTVLEAVQDRLAELRAGVVGWLPDVLALDEESGRGWQIGYAKVSGKWQLAARQVAQTGSAITATAPTIPLQAAPRSVRVEALLSMEKLILLLAERAGTFADAIAQTKARFTEEKDG